MRIDTVKGAYSVEIEITEEELFTILMADVRCLECYPITAALGERVIRKVRKDLTSPSLGMV